MDAFSTLKQIMKTQYEKKKHADGVSRKSLSDGSAGGTFPTHPLQL